MLNIRSNGDWEEFQQYRIKVNRSKLYPYRDITQEL